MANTSVKGRIVDENGAGIQELTVVAYDHDALFADDLLGQKETQTDGIFEITYPPGQYGLEANPDIQVRILDAVGRLVCKTKTYEDYSDTVLDLGTITIPRLEAVGWLATCRNEEEITLNNNNILSSKEPPLLSEQNQVDFLIDNEVAWKELAEAIKTAQLEINFEQFYFDVGNVFYEFNPKIPLNNGQPTQGKRIEDELCSASFQRSVGVRILIRDAYFVPRGIPLLSNIGVLLSDIPVLSLIGKLIEAPYPVDTADKVIEFFSQKNKINSTLKPVRFRKFSSSVLSPMHAKYMVFDNAMAFFCVSPLTQDYFDSASHSIDEPRRGPESRAGVAKLPVHDVSLKLQGFAVEHVNKTFYALWNQAGIDGTPTGETPPSPEDTPPTNVQIASSNTSVQIVRTLPEKRFKDLPFGERGILEAYQRAIRNAEKFIYLENQYFTEEAIANALIAAMKRNTNLQLIILLNIAPDTPGYLKDQQNLLRKIVDEKDINTRSLALRIGIFTLWSHESSTQGKPRIIPNYIHSKLAVIDDKWATAGSCNLDTAGLTRSVEVNAVMGSALGTPSTIAGDLRRALWAEHLGYGNPNDSELINPPDKGWCELWKQKAFDKVMGLGSTPQIPHQARILPFVFETNFEEYLKVVGVGVNAAEKLQILEQVKGFSFEKGSWR